MSLNIVRGGDAKLSNATVEHKIAPGVGDSAEKTDALSPISVGNSPFANLHGQDWSLLVVSSLPLIGRSGALIDAR